MKNPILFISTLFLLIGSNVSKAQVSAYTFTQTLSTYGAPNTGSLVGNNVQDDDVTTVNLPFPFVFNGTTYTTVNVCSNGYLSFGSLMGFEYNSISDLATTDVIAPFSQDLFMGTVVSGDLTNGSNTITNVSSTVGLSVGDELANFMGDFPGTPTITAINGNTIVINLNALNTNLSSDLIVMTGSLRQSTSGTSPNQVCEFEFRNMTRFSVYNEVINFKVRLYETSNKIEFVYGFMSPDVTGVPCEVGLKGSSSSDYNSRRVTSANTWSTSIASTQITHVCNFSNTKYPDNGLVYSWTPPSCTNPNIATPIFIPAICAGESATISVSGATTYSWSNGATTESIVISPSTTTTYTVFGFDGACSSSVSLTQQVNSLPSLSISSSPASLCSGQSATLTASGASTYTWSNNSVSNSIVVTPSSSATFSVKGSDGTCENMATLALTVNAVPSLSVTQTKTLICKGNSATLTASGAGSYTWNTGASSASVVVSPTSTAIYTVTGANGTCVANKTAAITVNNCTGIADLAADYALSVYPNPFNDQLSFSISAGEHLKVTLSDALGKVVYTGTLSAESKETISTSDLPAGLYILTLHDNGNQVSKKLIKR